MSLRRRHEPSPRLLALLAEGEGDAPDAGSDTGGDLAWVPVREEPREVAHPTARAAPDLSPGRHRRRRPPSPAVLAVPEVLRNGRFGVAWLAALALALGALVGGGVFAARVVWAQDASRPQPVGGAEGDGADGVTEAGDRSQFDGVDGSAAKGADATVGTGSGAMTSGGTASAAQGSVVVHVVGQVAEPGLVTIRAGSRVGDAIAKAGGIKGKAELAAVNLARVVVDGEQIAVPAPGETGAAGVSGASAPAAGGAASGAAGGAGAAGTPVNLNTADLAALETLPGVGPVLAQHILDWRTEHGGFTSVAELDDVSGIGEKTFAQLAPLCSV
ncbi:helix-hairpin-helix domain-containing protein [Janibacter sp. G56]|uniref:helix-hairpin-helix domain-containing protein n=1 Tax=Janibacter sp. G56 TaxID=3418717 RepID=UPI003D03F9BF